MDSSLAADECSNEGLPAALKNDGSDDEGVCEIVGTVSGLDGSEACGGGKGIFR